MTTIVEAFGVTPPKVAKYGFKVDCVNPELIIGLELETEGLNGNVDYAAIAKACNINIERDGSLRGASAEFTTKPMKTENALAAVRDFFDGIKVTEANYSDRCSTHVHVNCTDMDIEKVSNVTLLYTILEEIMFNFVGKYRDTNIYCVPWNQCRLHYNLVQDFLANPGNPLRGWNKYTALNLIPLSAYGTLEFRQMHGTRDMKKLTTWVNILGGIFKYANNVELKDLITQVKSLNTLSHYEAFFNEVTAGQLPYNELYRQKLEEGVIFAKYSLAGFGSGKKPARKVEQEPDAFLEVADGVAGFAEPIRRADGVLGEAAIQVPAPGRGFYRWVANPGREPQPRERNIAGIAREATERLRRNQEQIARMREAEFAVRGNNPVVEGNR